MGQGPLTDLKVLEFAGLGPAPFCGMLLSDLGADVIRIERKDARGASATEVTRRGRRSIRLDLKHPDGVEVCLRLMERAEAVFEGFRPGVMERLGLGPEVAHHRNPRIVYGRMTGWGQDGPYAQSAGHDLNYIALTGALHAIGSTDKPIPPLNLVGDFGGGALYLAFGLLAGVMHARATGRGQVIDCAMCDGAASLMALFYGMRAAGAWKPARQSNVLDGGAHYYDTYRCRDGRWIAIAAAEPQFYQLLLERLGISDPAFTAQQDRAAWNDLRGKLQAVFLGKTRDEWAAILEGTDACFAPVLDLDEAPRHPHNLARGTFVELAGVIQPAPVPRFSHTPGAIQSAPNADLSPAREVLASWGVEEADAHRLVREGVLADPSGAGAAK